MVKEVKDFDEYKALINSGKTVVGMYSSSIVMQFNHLIALIQLTGLPLGTFWGTSTLLVDLTSRCGPCKAISPVFAKMEKDYTNLLFVK
ncbi:hypothetical protein HDU99_004659, partial [Rhizoclosmatium hyalinum]